MKKKYTGLIIFICLIIIFQLLSGIFHKFAERKLQSYIQDKLPQGSMISNVKWNILSHVSAQNVRINTNSFIFTANGIRINYTFLAIFHRHIGSITMESPIIKIKSRNGNKHKKEKFKYPKISIDNVNIINGIFEKDRTKIYLTGAGNINSIQQKLYISIFKGGGNYNNKLRFSGIKGNIKGDRYGVKISNGFLQMKNGNMRITGLISKSKSKFEIKYQGNLGDLRNILPDYGLSGNVKTNLTLQFDNKNYVLKGKGKGKDIFVKNYKLGTFAFDITKELNNRVKFSFSRNDLKIKGKADSTDISAEITLLNFSPKTFKQKFPEAKITGKLNINSLKKFQDISFSGKLENKGIHIDSIYGNIKRNKKLWTTDGIYIKSGMGRIGITGTLNGKTNIYVEAKDFPLKNIVGLKKIPYSGYLTGSISLKNKKIVGDFGIKEIKGKGTMCDYAGGNINITDNEGTVDIALVNPSTGTLKFKTGYLNILIRNGYKFNGFMKGDHLALKLDGNGQKIGNEYQIILKHLIFAKGKDSLSSISPFRCSISPKGLKVENSTLRVGNGKILVSGVIGKENAVKIAGENINLYFVSTILSLKSPISGMANFSCSINGKGTQIKGKIEMPRYKQLNGDSLDFTVTVFPDKIMLDKFNMYDKGEMKIEGIIPIKRWKLSTNENIRLTVNLSNTSGWVFLPFSKYLEFKSGSITGNIGIKGQMNNPLFNGFLLLNNNHIAIPSVSTNIEQIQGVINMNGKGIEANNITGKIKTGKIEISGKAHLLPDASYNFDLQMDKVPFESLKDVSAVLDGKVNFSLRNKIPYIKGKVHIIKAKITTPFKKKETITAYKRKYYVNLGIDASNYNIWLRNDFANAEIGGDVMVIHNKEKWNISGLLKTKRGKLFYLDREFSLRNGEFHFLNTQEINPNITFLAATFVPPDDSIFLAVSGSMLTPKFNLYSKPPMPLDEIIALLNLNMRWDQLASIEEIENEFKKRAITYWVRKTLLKEIQSRVGLDVISLEEGERTRLVIGKYFTRNFYVTYSTDVLSYGYSKLHLEYRLGRWGNLVGEQNPSGKRSFTMQMRFRY